MEGDRRVKPIQRHPYRGDGIADHRRLDRCRDCGCRKDKPWHQMPAVDGEVAAVEARKLGDGPQGYPQEDS